MAAPLSAIGNDKELADFLTEHILDEDLDPQMIAILLSQAKNRLENIVKPSILEAEDTTKTRSSGESYTTMKDLPENFRSMIELRVDRQLFKPVPFSKREAYKNASLVYYIDHRNNQFAICGSGGAGTIRQMYLIKTDDFTASSVVDESAETCVWPKEHWPLIAWDAASMVSSGTDIGADDVSFRMSDAQREQYARAYQMFVHWDHALKLQEMDGRVGYADDEDHISLENDILPYL